jgi:hypothetical protein
MAATIIADMKEKIGKTLNQWLAVAKKTGADRHGQIVKAPKTNHGLDGKSLGQRVTLP